MRSVRSLLGGDTYKYTLLEHKKTLPASWNRKKSIWAFVLIACAGVVAIFVSSTRRYIQSCDTVKNGYQCSPAISHHWGQYSPIFTVPSDISADVPHGCHITFAQVLSRHGARDPTYDKGILYKALINKVKTNVAEFKGDYAFLADYNYTFGYDELTTFGQQQMLNSGLNFYQRYRALGRKLVPFVRSSGQKRVVDSAHSWTLGFRDAKAADHAARHDDASRPVVDVTIPEETESNNTLNHGLCVEFEDGPIHMIRKDAKHKWANTFAPAIQARINQDLVDVDLSITETVYLMDMCPFDTVASPKGTVSPFCSLFTEQEWHQYSYYGTLDKWYGYSYGNPLGPTQGVGFANELIARMTGEAVEDNTSTNRSLDSGRKTFPLGRQLYADFTHDGVMVAILSALGIYNGTMQLPNTTLLEAPQAGGFSASWNVPFAARAYVEKMTCEGEEEELVRVLVNDRVQPLSQCKGDSLGRCNLTAFVESLQFARSGGRWDQCFVT